MAVSLEKLFSKHPMARQFPSEANFILIHLPPGTADGVFAQLQAKKILVKNTGAGHPLLRDTLRITIGLPSENRAFIDALTMALTDISTKALL